jgi:hypothetical protein
VAGGGLALAIRRKWPGWHKHYLLVTPVLGNIDLYRADVSIIVCSFFAQDGYGHGKVFTDHDAFLACLLRLKRMMRHTDLDCQVYFPYKIGCGLAGGNWQEILSLISISFPDAVIVRGKQDK